MLGEVKKLKSVPDQRCAFAESESCYTVWDKARIQAQIVTKEKLPDNKRLSKTTPRSTEYTNPLEIIEQGDTWSLARASKSVRSKTNK
eukprot:5972785-Amphidinium_carterae.1